MIGFEGEDKEGVGGIDTETKKLRLKQTFEINAQSALQHQFTSWYVLQLYLHFLVFTPLNNKIEVHA